MVRRTVIDVGFEEEGPRTPPASADNNATAGRVNRDHPQPCFSQKRIFCIPSISLVPRAQPRRPGASSLSDDRPFRQ